MPMAGAGGAANSLSEGGCTLRVKTFFWESETYIETRSACHYTRPLGAVS